MKTNRKMQCREFEKILTNVDEKNITAEMNRQMKAHLQTCENCQNYQKNLINIKHQLQTPQMTPDPEIKKRVLNHQQALHPNMFRRLIQTAHDFLEYRIPLYQVVFTTISILLLIFMVDRLFLERHHILKTTAPSTKIEASLLEPTNMLNIQSIMDRQKIGRNVREDSVLARYIFQIGY
ncbi:zf-HC2 domain-containing protein [candidate division KSB1 bacterium]|nr:zf-HC2 domain-containing protein [candidate division KSB1 bacterium]